MPITGIQISLGATGSDLYSDLLKRHAASHDVDEGGVKRQRTSESGRTRVSQACAACAAAKLKCEQKKPCQRCQQKQISCDFPPASNRSSERLGSAVPLQNTESGNVFLDGTAATNINYQVHFGQNADQGNLQDPLQMQTASLEQPLMDFDVDDSSLADFLKDIMQASPGVGDPTVWTPRDVLNFGVDTLNFSENFDFCLPIVPVPGQLANYQVEKPNLATYPTGDLQGPASGTRTPDVRNSINLGTQAFKKSLWQWTPAQQDHGYAEQLNLSLPYQNIDSPEIRLAADVHLVDQRLEQSSRDKILAMILSTCEPQMFSRVVSSFPSAELLDNIMHQFFSYQLSQTNSWIHLPTFRPNEQMPELIAAIVAAGAVLSTVPVVRKLGFAIQEAVRLAIPKIFENDNRTTRDLQTLQAYALQLNIGLWSGDRRKMEMAESHALPLITMLRRAGQFRRTKLPSLIPGPSDDVSPPHVVVFVK